MALSPPDAPDPDRYAAAMAANPPVRRTSAANEPAPEDAETETDVPEEIEEALAEMEPAALDAESLTGDYPAVEPGEPGEESEGGTIDAPAVVAGEEG